MLSAIKPQNRAAEYRDLAQRSATLAAASPLDRVREKYETAANQWSSLAAIAESSRGLAKTRSADGR